MNILIGVDIGTSGVRSVAFSTGGESLFESRRSIITRASSVGRAEQHPQDWWRAVTQSLADLSRQMGPVTQDIRGIGVTGHCPSFTLLSPSDEVWEKAVLYHDERGASDAVEFTNQFGASEIHRRTGMYPSPFYLAPKLMWLLRHAEQTLPAGTMILQPKDFILYRLTGRLATDPTHAACTLLYDSGQRNWIREWMEALGLGHLRFPDVMPSCSILGCLTENASALTGLPTGLPVSTGAADSLCAALGANAWKEEILCDVSGSTTCLHLSTAGRSINSPKLNIYPHVTEGLWALESGLNTTGSAIGWLCRTLGATHDQLLYEADHVPAGCEGLLFFPHMAGGERRALDPPGAFVGLRLEHVRGHLMRAVLEGCAFALRDLVDIITSSGHLIQTTICCGGGSRSALWNQIKATILELPVYAASPADTTAYGAALTVARALHIQADWTDQRIARHDPEPSWISPLQEAHARFKEMEARLLR